MFSGRFYGVFKNVGETDDFKGKSELPKSVPRGKNKKSTQHRETITSYKVFLTIREWIVNHSSGVRKSRRSPNPFWGCIAPC